MQFGKKVMDNRLCIAPIISYGIHQIAIHHQQTIIFTSTSTTNQPAEVEALFTQQQPKLSAYTNHTSTNQSNQAHNHNNANNQCDLTSWMTLFNAKFKWIQINSTLATLH